MSDPIKRIERRSKRSIFQAYLESARKKGANSPALIDGDGKTFTFKEITRASFALGGALARKTENDERVGVLLPTGAGAVISIMAILSRGRVPAMLNFTSGSRNLLIACKMAQVSRIVTAKKFIEIANLHKLVEELSAAVDIVYLEDLKEEIKPIDKARALIGPFLPSLLAAMPNPEDPGVILFTSGTEGAPKGVVLSHRNIIANLEQISAHIDLLPTDIFFNPLPMFHCYGLTAGTLWPLLSGHMLALHPSPLQTKIIPKRIFDTGSTVLFATDTFLTQYMRAAKDGELPSLRIAVCGAERVRDETRQAAEKRFGFKVLEGYGVTEGSPVLAANQTHDIRSGTVGKMLPGIETRLEPVEGLENAGRLFVRGLNIMKGYISPDEPGVIAPPKDGWHDTGDIVAIDERGYVAIRGRLKRFAKIAGEMVSLAVVENCASAVWPDNLHAAAILPDPKKGEQVILVTDRQDAPRGVLLAWAQSHGVAELSVPKKIVVVDEIPVLGTGKIDFLKVKTLAEDGLEALAAKPTEAPSEPSKRELKKREAAERAEKKRADKEAKALAEKKDEPETSQEPAKSDTEMPEQSEPAQASEKIPEENAAKGDLATTPEELPTPANDTTDNVKDAAE